MLAELVELARKPSGEKRRELLGKVADLFLADARKYDDQEVVLFNDVLMRLLDHVGLEARAEFAGDVVDAPHASPALHEKLAEDEYEVAAPILAESDRLDDAVLLRIAREKGQGHLRAISLREELSEEVTDVLVDRGEQEVLHVVTANPGARFSGGTMDVLAGKAAGDASLAEVLCTRADIPPETAERVMEILPEHARRGLFRLMSSDRQATAELLKTVPRTIREERLSRRMRRLAIRTEIARIRDGEAMADGLIVDLANRNDVIDLCFVIARLAALDEHVVQSCLLKIEAEPIAVLLNAIDVTAVSVDAVARLRCRRLNFPSMMHKRMVSTWRQLDQATCERVMRFILIRSSAIKQSCA